VLVCPTAATHEGDRVLRRLGQQRTEHYRALGIAVTSAAEDPGRRDPRRGGGETRRRVGHLLRGNAGWPAGIVDTPFWAALQTALRDGLPYAGCSAGVACLTEKTFDSEGQNTDSIWAPGIGYVKDALFGPHWDIVDTWIPGATDFIAGSVGPGQTFIGLDEDTAIVGDGHAWEVMGRAKVHVLRDEEWTLYAEGDAFELPLRLADGPA
jgi:cyanophycinase-like exopeptidase